MSRIQTAEREQTGSDSGCYRSAAL